MSTVTISKIEYQNLRDKANAYGKMLEAAQGASSLVPTERSRKKIISAFKKTAKYNKKFLSSLNQGLKRSSYFVG